MSVRDLVIETAQEAVDNRKRSADLRRKRELMENRLEDFVEELYEEFYTLHGLKTFDKSRNQGPFTIKVQSVPFRNSVIIIWRDSYRDDRYSYMGSVEDYDYQIWLTAFYTDDGKLALRLLQEPIIRFKPINEADRLDSNADWLRTWVEPDDLIGEASKVVARILRDKLDTKELDEETRSEEKFIQPPDPGYKVVKEGVDPCNHCGHVGVKVTNNGVYCDNCDRGTEYQAIFVQDATDRLIKTWNENNTTDETI